MALVHNWKFARNIPWPCDLFFEYFLFYAYCYIACDEKFFSKRLLIFVFLMKIYFKIQVSIKIGMVLLLRNFYMERFFKIFERI